MSSNNEYDNQSSDELQNTDAILRALWENQNNTDSQTTKHFTNAIIKSFMIIFTREDCQFLLDNDDLIDITFNCLEHSLDISIEAQLQSAKLSAIILKFPEI